MTRPFRSRFDTELETLEIIKEKKDAKFTHLLTGANTSGMIMNTILKELLEAKLILENNGSPHPRPTYSLTEDGLRIVDAFQFIKSKVHLNSNSWV